MVNREYGPAEDQLLDTKGLAHFLGVSYKTAIKRMADGSVPAFRVGKLWRVRAEDARAIGRRDRES